MNFIYRNVLDQTVRFTLGNPPHLIEYAVSPGSTVVIPEKYDYAIEAMGIRLEKDYEQSIIHDSASNPERWNDFLSDAKHSDAEQQSDGYEESLLMNTPHLLEPKKRAMRGRKKKVIDGIQ